MGMNVGSGSGSSEPEVMLDINTTPLIDVMLVLLVMLIVTLPPQRQVTKIDTPQAATTPQMVKPLEPVRIAIDFDGAVYWNGEAVDREGWEQRMAVEAKRAEQPEIHIEPHKLAHYGQVAAVMASAQRSGLEKLGVTGGT